jgi:subtilisin family serine protease
MIIGLKTKPVLAAHLTGQEREKVSAPADNHPVPIPNNDKVSLSRPVGWSSRSTAQDLASKLSAARDRVAEQERFMEKYEHVPDQVLVRVKKEISNFSELAGDYGSSVIEAIDTTGLNPSEASSEQILLLDLKGQLSVAEAMVLMADDPRVSVVESNDIVRTQVVNDEPKEPNDLEDSLWGLYNHGQEGGKAGVDIGSKQAWQASVGSRTGPIVAVIDTGVDIRHQDLKDNIFVNLGEVPNDGIDNDGNGVIDDVNGYNAADDTNDPSDENGHGTHVAGTIGAVGNNGKGVTGVNQEARILPIRFLDSTGAGSTAGAIKALVYASRTGARVINNSWGGDKFNQLVFDAMADSKALLICAAGNEAYDNDLRPVYPADYPLDNVISVTAHDRHDEFPKFANRGEKSVELAAPGVDITSTMPGNKYGMMSGTSMATPHVAGAATLLATVHPDISNQDLKFLLMHNLEQLPEKYGSRIISGGRLNIGHALEKDEVPPSPVSDLKLDSATPTKVSVSWLAPGDDGVDGRASAYEARYTLGHFQSDENKKGVPFEDARRLQTGTPKQALAKESVQFSLTPSGKERNLTLGVLGVDNVLNSGGLATLSVNVPAAKVALEDDADSTAESAFQPSEHWTRVAVEGRGSVFTESPNGDYPSERDAILLSKPFSLKGFEKPVLHFDCKFDVERKHDKFVVEIEKDGWFGKKWKEVARFDGISDWESHKLDVSGYTGKDDVRLRFRLESDKDRNRDGVFLDNVVIAEGGQ